MPNRVLETVLTGRNLLSPMLATASRDVVAFNSTVARANVEAGTSAATSAGVQQGAATKIAASNVKASTSASASAEQQMRAHTRAAESATVSSRVQQSANRALAASNGLLGTSLTPLTAGLGATALALGYAGFKGMEFGSAMSQVQAASQASAADMGRFRDAAVDAGAKTQYSSVEAAQGITEMSKAGVSARDIIGGGLTGALNLAAAGQISVAEAAETGATALSVFRLEGNQMSHVADLLAAGAGKAQGSVGDLSAALNQSALVASQTGLSIEDTAGALAMFASNGLIGSDAGTSFKTMLQALTPNSEAASKAMDAIGFSAYDAQGKFVGMESVAAQLRTGLAGLSEEQRNTTLETIFGSDAVRAASVLYKEGARGVEEWTNKVDDAGYAQRQAAQLTDNLRGDLEKLGGSVDTFFTSLGEGTQGPLRLAVQMLTAIVNAGGDVIGFFTSLPGPVQAALAAVGGLALLRGPLDGLFTSLAGKITGVATGMGMAAVNAGGFKGAMTNMIGAINPVTLALTLASVAVTSFIQDSAEVDARMQSAADAGDDFRSTLAQQRGELNDASIAAAEMAVEAAGLADAFDRLGISSRQAAAAMSGSSDDRDEILASLEDMDRQAMFTNESWNQLFGTGTRMAMDAVSGKATENASAFREAAGAADGYFAIVGNVDAGGWGRAVEGQSEAAAAATAQTEAATKALEEWLEQLQQVGEGFVEPLGVYQDLLSQKQEADRKAAEAQAADTESMTDSWEDYVTNVGVSLDEYATKLEEQLTAQANWRTNIGLITQAGGLEVGQHLAAMGVEGAGLVQQMVDAIGTEEFPRLRDLMIQEAAAGGAGAAAALDAEMKVMAAIGEAGAGATALAIAQKLDLGLADVQAIAAKYGIAMATGLEPLLTALGSRTVALRARGEGMRNADGNLYEDHQAEIAPGGAMRIWAEPETGGESYIPHAESKRPRALDIWRRTGKILNAPEAQYYANGAFVSTSDVPKPRSTAPYGPPVSTAGDLTMQTAYEETVAWMKAHAGIAGGGSVGGDWQSIFNWVKARVPQARVNSAYRPGDPGYHGRGKAVDFGFGSGPGGAGSAGLALINRTLHDGIGANLAELIYDGLGDDRPDLHMGAAHTYSKGTQKEHQNHVHAAVRDQGGPVYPGLNLIYNGTGQNEWVLPPAAMPGYGGTGGGGGGVAIDYDRLAAAVSKAGGTHIAVDASNRDHRAIARAIVAEQREQEWLSNP